MIYEHCSRTVWSTMITTSHLWLFKFRKKVNKIKKISFLVMLPILQVLYSYLSQEILDTFLDHIRST